ncbi:hypothetical protein Tco_0727579 [Tanacetum coccineum]|uniref:Uncharacterized protein n=1 Tax=Tanacetum coccineum TaxID=301880 RepID=A0ABQ4YIR8_9ASTR
MELKTSSSFKTTGLLQPWQTLCKILSICLTTRVTGWDQPPLQIMQMMYCFVNNIHVDYAELLWEGIYCSLHHPTSSIPYPRFTKIIVRRHKDKLGMQIPDWMITKEMKHTEHYRMYAEVFGLNVPLTQSQLTESTQGTHRTPSAPRSRFLWYIDTKPNGEGLRKSILFGPYVPSTVLVQVVAATEGNPAIQQHTTIETVLNMTPKNKEHFLSEKEAIFLLLTGIGDDIYSTVDACKTANEMWIAIERLQQGESLNVQDVKTNLFWEFGKFTSRDGESMESYYSRFYKLMNELTRNNLQVTTMQVNVQFLQQLQPEWSRFVTVVKQSKEIDTISYHTLFDILKQYQNEVNDIRAERIAKSANPLALLAAAQPYSDNYYQAPKPQRSNATSSSTRPSASTRHKGKEIAKPVTPQSESVSEEDSDPEQAQRDKDMQKNLALLAKYFKTKYFTKIYKPTNNNFKTSSNFRNQELKIPHKVVPLQAEQADWLADTDEEIDEQELEAHYSFMAKIQEYSYQKNPVQLNIHWNRIATTTTQNREPQLPHASRNTNPYVFESLGVNHTTSVSRPQLKCYQVKDKVVPNNSQVKFKKKEVEDHHRISSISKKTKSVTACNDSSNSKTSNVNAVCAECGKCVFNSNHDACVSRYLNDVNARTKKPNVVPISWLSKPSEQKKNLEWKWWIAKTCPSGYTWTQKPLRTKKIWMPKIRKDDVSTSISPTIDIGTNSSYSLLTLDAQSNMTSSLKLLCILVEKFLDLPGSDLLTGNPWMPNHYTIHIKETTSSTQSVSWQSLPKLKYVKDQLCLSCEISKAKRSSFKSKAVPSSKGRLNLLHMDLCGPMRMKLPEVLKDVSHMIQRNLQAQVISGPVLNSEAQSSEQNTSMLNREKLDKIKEKKVTSVPGGNNPTQSKGYRIYNKRTRLIVESIHIKFDEIKEMMADHNSSDLAQQRQEISVENVFSGLVPQGQKASDYDNSGPVPPRQNVVPTAEKTDSSHQELEFLFTPLIEEYYTPSHGHAEENNNDQAPNASFQEDEFINPFCTRVQETGESSLCNIDNTDVHSFQPQSHDYRWTRDHPLEQVRGNLTMPVQTRRQLATDPKMKRLIDFEEIPFAPVARLEAFQDFRCPTAEYVALSAMSSAMSLAEAEYVALSASCAQVMWMRTQLQDYGFNYNKIPLYCDSQSAIAISCNPVQHSRTKHIHTRYHFIKEQVENGIIELYFVRTEYQLADMFTKALPEDRFKYLVRRIGMRCLTPAELEVLTNETA